MLVIIVISGSGVITSHVDHFPYIARLCLLHDGCDSLPMTAVAPRLCYDSCGSPSML